MTYLVINKEWEGVGGSVFIIALITKVKRLCSSPLKLILSIF
jgi:hypothetical protein